MGPASAPAQILRYTGVPPGEVVVTVVTLSALRARLGGMNSIQRIWRYLIDRPLV